MVRGEGIKGLKILSPYEILKDIIGDYSVHLLSIWLTIEEIVVQGSFFFS
jgi:hypothetical protein